MDEDRECTGVRGRARALEDGARDVWDDGLSFSVRVGEEDANSGPCLIQI